MSENIAEQEGFFSSIIGTKMHSCTTEKIPQTSSIQTYKYNFAKLTDSGTKRQKELNQVYVIM